MDEVRLAVEGGRAVPLRPDGRDLIGFGWNAEANLEDTAAVHLIRCVNSLLQVFRAIAMTLTGSIEMQQVGPMILRQ